MRVHFSRDYDHVETMKTITFKADQEVTVTQEIGRAAVKARAATEVRPEQPAKTADGE